MVETWTDRDLARAARSALQKVEAVLPEPLVDVLTNVALYVPNVPRARYMTDGLSDLRKAIVTHHKVRFDYERADGARTTRTVRPLGLYFWGSKWSLAAWCELREDYRNFRPDRMAHLQLTDDPFPTDDGITLEAFLESSRDR